MHNLPLASSAALHADLQKNGSKMSPADRAELASAVTEAGFHAVDTHKIVACLAASGGTGAFRTAMLDYRGLCDMFIEEEWAVLLDPNNGRYHKKC